MDYKMGNMTGSQAQKGLVLGATGFVGSALVQRLLAENMEVQCMVHKSKLPSLFGHLQTIKTSLTDFEWNSLDEDSPDVIYHFARITEKGSAGRKKAALINARANERLIDWLHSQDNPPLLVFGSGTLTYGNHLSDPVYENAALHPISYQKEYILAERPILDALHQNTIPVMIVRPPWIYGPASWFKWFYHDFMIKNNSIPLYGNGQNYMSLIHQSDCAGLIHFYSRHGSPGNIYNITGHSPILQIEFANTLASICELAIRKIPSWKMRLSYDQATRTALLSSLYLDTIHRNLLKDYVFQFPELSEGIRHVLQNH